MLRLLYPLVSSHCHNKASVWTSVGHIIRKGSNISVTSSIFLGTISGKNCFEMAKPTLVVFDLDYTLWPFWVDTHVHPPFKMASNGKVYDSHGQHVKFYEDVPSILERLRQEGYQLGIASRTGATSEARDLLRLFNWDQYFHFSQIYPGCKITHFKKLQEQSGVSFKEMIFFDDEQRNTFDVSSLGVTCILCPDGVSNKVLMDGFDTFRKCYVV